MRDPSIANIHALLAIVCALVAMSFAIAGNWIGVLLYGILALLFFDLYDQNKNHGHNKNVRPKDLRDWP